MSRPQRVSYNKLHEYDKLHTKKVKMYSGVEITALYPIKETEQYYLSPEVWSHCCSKFKMKKKNITLSVDLPEITDTKTIEFLNEHAWHDWVDEERNSKKSDIPETIALLDKLYPNKKKVFFYELDSIISAYAGGTFIAYDENGNVKPDREDLRQRRYYNQKYTNKMGEDFGQYDIKKAYDAYKLCCEDKNIDPKIHQEAYGKYSDLHGDYVMEHLNITEQFIQIGKNSVVYPVAFSNNTAEWSREKYGKLIAYAEAGEIMFVVTPDAIFFDIKRHY